MKLEIDWKYLKPRLECRAEEALADYCGEYGIQLGPDWRFEVTVELEQTPLARGADLISDAEKSAQTEEAWSLREPGHDPISHGILQRDCVQFPQIREVECGDECGLSSSIWHKHFSDGTITLSENSLAVIIEEGS